MAPVALGEGVRVRGSGARGHSMDFEGFVPPLF